jgi:transposase
MKFIQGKPRNQWEMYCLDEHVDADNVVRLIDLFVDSLNLTELGFMAGRRTVILPSFPT